MSRLEGIKPGIWCPVYHKSKDRTECQNTKCKYWQNHRVTPILPGGQDGSEHYDESGNAQSVKSMKLPGFMEQYEIHEECDWHCVKYDEPSKMIDVPWELS